MIGSFYLFGSDMGNFLMEMYIFVGDLGVSLAKKTGLGQIRWA